MMTYAGLPTARGFASGPVFLYRGDGELVVPEYRIPPGEEEAEIGRLQEARRQTRRDLEGLIAVLRERTSREDVRVFECHLMILEDPTLSADTERLIRDEHLNAAAATRRVAAAARSQFERMNDPYFRERVRDFDDVERRLLMVLCGLVENAAVELRVPSIVVADDLTPSETMRFPREFVLGFATNGGSATSHVALLARSMGIPAVTGLGDITTAVEPGGIVLLDGSNGAITVNPDAAAIADFRKLEHRQREFLDAAVNAAPAGTLKDGSEVLLFANAHPGVPFAGVREFGARGIGLYRSEYLWLSREMEPTEEEQFVAYRDVAKFASSLTSTASVTIRVLDIGGDKTVRGITQKEANPFLGNRSIRYLLSNPSVFRTQLRAILRASAFGRVSLMYPMVSCVEELTAAARMLAAVKGELTEAGVPFDPELKVGAMIEVPAAALNVDVLVDYVDFLSIGTNDLIQYLMAADRGNDAVAHLYQPMHPAVLQVMRNVIGVARRHGKLVGVCGESAADSVVGILWVAMGANLLSMSPAYIPVQADLLRRLSRADLDDYLAFVSALSPTIPADEAYRCAQDWLNRRVGGIDSILL